MKNENARLRADLQTIGTRVCHDLRTPLGGIVTSAELLRETVAESDPATASALTSLFASVDELTRLIKNLSVVAKASAEPLPKENVAMAEIISRVLPRLESRCLKNRAVINQPEAWPEVAGVPEWLECIWTQLLGNALQHGGPKIELGWERDRNEHWFWVSDNGDELPAILRSKLFQPFETLHLSGSARGLGLSLVRRLVELQGGQCDYEPMAHGNRFCFALPNEAGA